MIHYVTSFIVYTLAMTGVLVIGFVIYKKAVSNSPAKKNSMLKIADMLRLPDRKTLYVINCRGEQFLIASSNDKVTLISKLETIQKRKKEDMIEKYLKEKEEENPNLYLKQEEAESKKHFIKSLLKELSDNNKTKRSNY